MRHVIAATCLFLALASPAQAKKLSIACTGDKFKYEVTYDDLSKVVTTNHKLFDKKLKIERLQEDGRNTLIWISMDLGPAQRYMLAQFGREKWVKHFYGQGLHTQDNCI